MWNFFRVENGHLANVANFHVAQKIPLPFIGSIGATPVEGPEGPKGPGGDVPPTGESTAMAHRAGGKARLALARVTDAFRATHAEDFGRKVNQKEKQRKGRFPDVPSECDVGDVEMQSSQKGGSETV